MPKLDRTETLVLFAALLLATFALIGDRLLPGYNADFTWDPNYLPYKLEKDALLFPPEGANDNRAGNSFNVIDYYGNGSAQYVQAGTQGITGQEYIDSRNRNSKWQYNVPGRFLWASRCAGIFSGLDPDQDGRDEIVMYYHTKDGTEHEICSYDPLRETVEGRVSLPGGADRNGDGVWDGTYRPCGVFTYEKKDKTKVNALLVVCSVKYDGYGRGIFAVDLAAGEILWHYPMAPFPEERNIEVVDLDGDGLKEIVVGAKSPANLGKELINGTSDSQAMVFVFSCQGNLLWARVIAPRSSGITVKTCDFDGKKHLDVVSTASSISRPYSEISVWDGMNGDLKDRSILTDEIYPLIYPNPSARGSSELFVCTSSNLIKKFNIFNSHIELKGQLASPGKSQISFVGDMLPEPGHEFVLNVRGQGIWVLNNNMHPLAFFGTKNWQRSGNISLLNQGPGNNYLLCSNRAIGCLKITEQTRLQQIDPKPGLRGASVLFLATGAMAIRRRRRDFYRKKLDINDSNVLRELRLRLLSDLELSGHGAVGILKSLRRLVWNLESRCAGMGESTDMNKRLTEMTNDFTNSILPHVKDILGLAEQANIARPSVKQSYESLEEIQYQLTTIAESGFSSTTIQDGLISLHDSADRAETGLQKIRQTVENLFLADLPEVLDLILRARKEDLDSAHITVDWTPPDNKIICRIDSSQLEFMLDNLVGNSIRAMADCAKPTLTIFLSLTDGFVLCDVTDTGWGIDPEDWARVMETPYSSRTGGGLGLFETNRLLRLYGGMISIKQSKPGHGTTIRLTVPEARSTT